ncbi:Glycolipid transfer protein [Halotydeus destructor]|nr:Glycolipid transfer protein [Halotydeus destructor]
MTDQEVTNQVEKCDSFFSACAQFPDVEDGNLVPTEQFLEASRSIVKFVEFLGAVFSPVKSDINGNIGKLSKLQSENPESFAYLNNILDFEAKGSEGDQVSPVGTDALLWLKRAIEYIKIFLTLFVQDFDSKQNSSDLSSYFGFAYEATLKKHHNWFVQKIFSVCLHAAPGRSQLLKLLSSSEPVDEQVVFDGIKAYLTKLEKNIEAVHAMFDKVGFNYKS